MKKKHVIVIDSYKQINDQLELVDLQGRRWTIEWIAHRRGNSVTYVPQESDFIYRNSTPCTSPR